MQGIYHGHGNIVQFHWVWSWWNISPMRIFFLFFSSFWYYTEYICTNIRLTAHVQYFNPLIVNIRNWKNKQKKKLTKINLWNAHVRNFFFVFPFVATTYFSFIDFRSIVDSVDSSKEEDKWSLYINIEYRMCL